MSDQPFTVSSTIMDDTVRENLSPASDEDIMKGWDRDVIKSIHIELNDMREYLVFSLRNSFFCIRENGLLGFYTGGAFENIAYTVDMYALVKREIEDCCSADGTLDADTLDYVKNMRDSLSSALSIVDSVLEPIESK